MGSRPDPDKRDVERHLGNLMAALFRINQKGHAKEAFDCAGAAGTVISGFRMDLLKTGKVRYDDL